MTAFLPKTEEELTNLARRVVRREIYVAFTQDEIRDSFGAILALGHAQIKEWLPNIGLIYEEYAKAAPRAINGRPMFFSCQFLHKADVEFFIKRVMEFQELLDPQT